MNELRAAAAAQPEHLSVAMQFANEMIDRFDPEVQNEVLVKIKELFFRQREKQITELTERIDRLKSCLDNLSNI